MFSSPLTASKSIYLRMGEDEHAGAVRSHAHQPNGKREIHDWLWILLQTVKCVQLEDTGLAGTVCLSLLSYTVRWQEVL